MPKDGGDSEVGKEESIDEVGILDFAPNKMANQSKRSKGPTKPTRRSAVSKLKVMIDAKVMLG